MPKYIKKSLREALVIVGLASIIAPAFLFGASLWLDNAMSNIEIEIYQDIIT